MSELGDEEVLASLGVSAPRRVFAVAVLSVAGGSVIYSALTADMAFVWIALLVAGGLAVLWMAQRLWHVTGERIELTATELRSSDGTRIAAISDIERLDRGFLAVRPSNGFLIRLRTPAQPVWRPGMWWRVGSRAGVGGVTPAAGARAMADMLSAMLAERG